jgi:Right handed beta helix region
LDAHVSLSKALKAIGRSPDPAHLKPQNSLSFLALFFLIALAFCGWGCSGGTGALAARPLTSTGANAASSSAASPGAATGSASSATPPPPNTAPANTVSLLHFGNAGFGGDDTNVLQTALNDTAANGQTLEIPSGGYNINPISFPANSSVFVDAGVTVTANSGYGDGVRMLNISSSNVTITGASAAVSVFHMRKAEYTSGEQRHCLNIANASNVTISGISCNDSGGDGLYVSYSTSVTVQDSVFDNNRRQGSSIVGGVNHIHYLRDHFTNTSGTAPQSGIDIEPNQPQDFLLDVRIEDSYTDGNAGDGLMVSTWRMNSTSQPISVTVSGHHSTGNARYGYIGQNNDPSNAPGTILIQDSFSDQSGSYGAAGYFYEANGAALIFQNLTVTNPHARGPSVYGDSAAVAVVRGGGGVNPIGNVHFLNVNIAITDGKTDRYFYFQDNTGKGVTSVQFVPGTLSGATQAPPNGLLNSVATNEIP